MAKKTLAFVVYPGISLLELVGNCTQFASALTQGPPSKDSYDLIVVGEHIEAITTDTPLSIFPQKTFAEVTQPDMLIVVGGGADTLPALENANLIAYIQRAAEGAEWVAATSTGSLLLAAAGLLEGRQATTHWAYADRLQSYQVHYQGTENASYVTDGKFTTAAGVSGAIDMAIDLSARLKNQTAAQFGQMIIEYDPHPPFGRLDWTSFEQQQSILAPLMKQRSNAQDTTQQIAFVLYPGLTVFDLVGPLQVFSVLQHIAPEIHPVVVAETLDPVMTDIGVRMVPNATFADLPHPDAFFVPGGVIPTLKAMSNPGIRQYIRTAAPHAQWVVSVCTGSLLLAAVGLLEGREVTTHWAFQRYLKDLGAHYVQKRWTINGNIVNAAGVSAGIDMALFMISRLKDEETAHTVQWLLQYDPQPPFGGIDYQHIPVPARLFRTAIALIAPLYTNKVRRLIRQEGKATIGKAQSDN